MGQRRGLIDTNVLVAVSHADHIHHEESKSMVGRIGTARQVISLHSLSEFYNIATRPFPRGLGSAPATVMRMLAAFEAQHDILSLTPDQHIDAIRHYAASGGIGPRLYDYLIGYVAVVHAIPSIITWNVKHMAPLFPASDVVTPTQFIAAVGQ
jgi:predicted nucleic acid-binding protein